LAKQTPVIATRRPNWFDNTFPEKQKMTGIKKASQRLNITAIRLSLQQMRLAIQSIEAQLPIDDTHEVPNPFTVHADVENREQTPDPTYCDKVSIAGPGNSPALCDDAASPAFASQHDV
jgi:hypothetical protein